MCLVRTIAAFVSCVLLLSFTARADELGPREIAKQHYDAGRAAFRRGDYRIADDEFERAYTLSSSPPLLYNIGRCLEKLDRIAEAITYYQRFIAATPDEEIRAHIDVLRARVALDQNTGAPVAVRATAPPRKPIYERWWLWTTVGVVVAAGVGIGLGVGLTRSSGNTFPTLSARP